MVLLKTLGDCDRQVVVCLSLGSGCWWFSGGGGGRGEFVQLVRDVSLGGVGFSVDGRGVVGGVVGRILDRTFRCVGLLFFLVSVEWCFLWARMGECWFFRAISLCLLEREARLLEVPSSCRDLRGCLEPSGAHAHNS